VSELYSDRSCADLLAIILQLLVGLEMKLTIIEVYVHAGIEGWQSIEIFIKCVSALKEKEALGSALHGL
jgi:hypothetical protein